MSRSTYCSGLNGRGQQSARRRLSSIAHGFALALVLVSLWCDGASTLGPAALVPRQTRVQTSVWGGSLISQGSCGSGVAGPVLARWNGPVMLLPERWHHGVVTKRIGWPGPGK